MSPIQESDKPGKSMTNSTLDLLGSYPTEKEAILGLGERFPVPPFRVSARELQPAWDGKGRPDALIELEWSGEVQRFAVEFKSLGTPKQVEFALQQVRRYTKNLPEVAPLIIAPYLRQELLEQLVLEEVSGIDLSGNYAVVIPGRWLVIRTGSKNQFPSSAPIKNVYRGKSSLISRALMLRSKFSTATTIKKELEWLAPVTLPTISKVLKALEEELIIERDKQIKVIQPDRLLDNLLRNFERPKSRLVRQGKLGLMPALTERMNKNARKSGTIYAANSPTQYTVLPSSESITRLYTSSIEGLLQGLEFDTSTRFPDIELVETSDLGVYYDRRQRGELFWTSPLQVYLDLATSGKRERQAAEQIRIDLLTFKYM